MPSIPSSCITFWRASAATTFTACPELCPSPCPGAPSTIGSCHATPGFWFALGIPSMSLPKEMTGPPDPHRANHAVGIPDEPRSTSHPCSSRIPVMYADVSISCCPSSEKEKILSTMTWASFVFAATSSSTRSSSAS